MTGETIARTVTLHGKAKDAKAGAVLMIEDERVVYIEGLDGWPQELFGRLVTATGVLVRKKFIPDPVGEDDELRQGAEGEQEVLEGAIFRIDDTQ